MKRSRSKVFFIRRKEIGKKIKWVFSTALSLYFLWQKEKREWRKSLKLFSIFLYIASIEFRLKSHFCMQWNSNLTIKKLKLIIYYYLWFLNINLSPILLHSNETVFSDLFSYKFCPLPDYFLSLQETRKVPFSLPTLEFSYKAWKLTWNFSDVQKNDRTSTKPFIILCKDIIP